MTDTRFKPGWKGGPGRPKGSKNKLEEDFLKALADDFAAHGVSAIQVVRLEKPSDYIKVIASLMPKEVEIVRPLEDLSDAELADAVDYLRAKAAESAGSGSADPAGPEQAEAVRSVH